MEEDEELSPEAVAQMVDTLAAAGDPLPAHVALPVIETHESPTLASLDPSRRPDPRPVCAACPKSMWFASTGSLKCFCRAMHAVTWASEEPNQSIQACDGVFETEE